MVCPRCITAVKNIMDTKKIEYSNINLGEVITNKKLTEIELISLSKALKLQGFELLEDSKSKTIAQIKSIIIQQVQQLHKTLKVNYSNLLSQKLNQDYTVLSKLFSSVEGITIEKYIVKQKIEKVKELMFYNEKTLSEIAFLMDYSSSAHLSNQFKKETGMTPTQFKKTKHPTHKSLDSI
tara:strand:- start:124 stop:663 length:540 start_codon:yes stop_codon:yes gene_type:complete